MSCACGMFAGIYVNLFLSSLFILIDKSQSVIVDTAALRRIKWVEEVSTLHPCEWCDVSDEVTYIAVAAGECCRWHYNRLIYGLLGVSYQVITQSVGLIAFWKLTQLRKEKSTRSTLVLLKRVLLMTLETNSVTGEYVEGFQSLEYWSRHMQPW